ncbi:MAG: FAD-linked oxidase C-terminal domain-containing protein, partial [Actinomycetes bacterium]
ARAVRLGSGAGESWRRHRFDGPHLRDTLLDEGVCVETLETAATWSSLAPTYSAVRGALVTAMNAQGTPPLVGCHVSHLYETGASLYFTALARQRPGHEVAQWRAAKAAACEAIVASGAVLTHHHAVGRDHLPYLGAEIGDLGTEVLRALKRTLDPDGLCNPGVLVP